MKFMTLLTPIFLSVAFLGSAMADTPASLAGPHAHASEVTGKVTLFRAQEQGLEIGKGQSSLDAEILVTLDSQPGKVFGIRLHETNAAAQQMVETLRAAYLSGKKVTIQHRMNPKSNNLKILWVQFGDTPPAFAGN